MTTPYDDIIYLPHPVSKHHAPMTLWQRAAQFAPFAALTGFEACIAEAARLTCEQRDLSEWVKDDLSRRLEYAFLLTKAMEKQLAESAHPADIHALPVVSITYFKPDLRKSGGDYVTVTGTIRQVESCFNRLTLVDCHCTNRPATLLTIPLDAIYEIKGDIFNNWE